MITSADRRVLLLTTMIMPSSVLHSLFVSKRVSFSRSSSRLFSRVAVSFLEESMHFFERFSVVFRLLLCL